MPAGEAPSVTLLKHDFSEQESFISALFVQVCAGLTRELKGNLVFEPEENYGQGLYIYTIKAKRFVPQTPPQGRSRERVQPKEYPAMAVLRLNVNFNEGTAELTDFRTDPKSVTIITREGLLQNLREMLRSDAMSCKITQYLAL